MTTRRSFLFAGALGATIPTCLLGQSPPLRIGILSPGKDPFVAPMIVQALSEAGYRDGAEVAIDFREADDVRTQARELVDAKCALIFALGNDLAPRALRETGTDIPVVFVAINYDPVEKGIVASLARPGGSITGVYLPTIALAVKRFELASEMLPPATRFIVLSDTLTKHQLAAIRHAAQSRKIQLHVVEYDKEPYDFAGSFNLSRNAGAFAVLSLTSRRLALERAQIAALALSHGMPAFGPGASSDWLGSYTINGKIYARRAAHIAVRLLRGAKPADVPVEQPDEFEIMVNLRLAKQLGIKIPSSVLVRATKIIE